MKGYPSRIFLIIHVKGKKYQFNKKCIWLLMQNLDYSSYVHLKSPLLYDWCMFIEFHPSINILIQARNFNP
jgi:hypothetical protein